VRLGSSFNVPLPEPDASFGAVFRPWVRNALTESTAAVWSPAP
jgi:hypothetical protein